MSAGDAGNCPAADVPGSITTVHRYELPFARSDVWSLISDVSQYRVWWPWLRVFDAAALAEGEEWRCHVQPPVPYLVRFAVVIDHVEAASLVRATVTGDVVDGVGCTATLRSSLAPGNAALRLVSRLAAPVARFGHDWVLESGARQFVARAVEPLAGEETAQA